MTSDVEGDYLIPGRLQVIMVSGRSVSFIANGKRDPEVCGTIVPPVNHGQDAHAAKGVK